MLWCHVQGCCTPPNLEGVGGGCTPQHSAEIVYPPQHDGGLYPPNILADRGGWGGTDWLNSIKMLVFHRKSNVFRAFSNPKVPIFSRLRRANKIKLLTRLLRICTPPKHCTPSIWKGVQKPWWKLTKCWFKLHQKGMSWIVHYGSPFAT